MAWSDPDDWATAIGDLLGAPVLVGSWGPAAADKAPGRVRQRTRPGDHPVLSGS